VNAQGARPARKIKTFQDVSGAAAAAAAAAAAGLGAMLPLSQSDWLPPIMAPRPPKSGGALDAQAGQLGQQTAVPTAAQLSGLDLNEPPVDWSLKTSLRFTSSQEFSLLDAARTAPRSEGKYINLQYFLVIIYEHLSSTPTLLLFSQTKYLICPTHTTLQLSTRSVHLLHALVVPVSLLTNVS
jgi:hypothetical protein